MLEAGGRCNGCVQNSSEMDIDGFDAFYILRRNTYEFSAQPRTIHEFAFGLLPLAPTKGITTPTTQCLQLSPPTLAQILVHHVASTRVHAPRNNHRTRRPRKDNSSRQPHRVQWDHQRTSRRHTAVSRQRCRRTTSRNHHESIGHWITTCL